MEELLAGAKEFEEIRKAFFARCLLREILDYPLDRMEDVLDEIQKCQEILKTTY